MCKLCDQWVAGTIKIGPALKKIAKKIESAKNNEEIQHLWKLSDRILEDDTPTDTRNESIDAEWWDSTHKKSE